MGRSALDMDGAGHVADSAEWIARLCSALRWDVEPWGLTGTAVIEGSGVAQVRLDVEVVMRTGAGDAPIAGSGSRA